jgi:hypothetical protein
MIASNRTVTVDAGKTRAVALQRTRAVGINETVAIDPAPEIAVGGAQPTTVGKARQTSVAENDKLSLGKNLVISAADSASTGDARIAMKRVSTIVIKCTDVRIECSGKITAKTDSDVVLKGLQIAQNRKTPDDFLHGPLQRRSLRRPHGAACRRPAKTPAAGGLRTVESTCFAASGHGRPTCCDRRPRREPAGGFRGAARRRGGPRTHCH